jgi:Protein of unknown function (DUF4238)
MATQTQFTHDQHIVPQWHLRNFVDGNGNLWRYKQRVTVKKSRPKGECWAKDFYECEINGERTDNRYESWLGRIENDAAARLRTLLSHTPLGQWDAMVWAAYVASLFVRGEKYRAHMSAEMIRRFRNQVTAGDYIRNLQYDLLKKGELVPAEDIRKRTEQLLVQMETTPFYHLIGMQNNTVSLGDAIMRKTWHVIQAPTGRFFITSDCPVTTVELIDGQVRPGSGFGRPATAVVLALTPEYLFVAAAPEVTWRAVAEPKLVDSVNLLTTQFAHKRVYAHVNSLAVQGLVDAEMNNVVFGVNAFLPGAKN